MSVSARDAASKRVFDSIKHNLFGLGVAGLLGIGAVATTPAAQAADGITSVTVLSSGLAFGGCSIGNIGTFSFMRGYAVESIDPTNPLNTPIIDIGNAQKDANGHVNVLFNFDMIYPTNLERSNGKVIVDVPNRSGSTLGQPNRSVGGNAPEASATNCNNTYFWPQGYATLDFGWEADPGTDPTKVTNTGFSAVGTVGGNTMTPLSMMPIAVGPGNATLTGPSYEYIVVGNNTTGSFNVGGGLSTPNYPAAPLGASCTSSAVGTLTHRKHLDDTPTVLPSANWQWNIGADGNCDSVSLTTAGDNNTPYFAACAAATGACFLADDIYELSYTAANPTVNAAGMAVIRDFLSWVKGNSGSASQTSNPLAGHANQLYTWTSSQPARTLNDYLHFGFNGDLGGKRVVDGMVNWIGAGAGLSWNYRWSHTTGTERNRQQHLWVESFFPFADVTTTDPISGTTDGRYLKCSANNTCPVMNFEQYSANEYWVKTASLLHTDPTGTTDLPDHPLTRRYYMSGMQHGGGNQNSKASVGSCQNWNNPTDPTYTVHALWAALDQNITGNVPPPPSQIPTLASKTLVSPQTLGFPSGWTQTTAAGTIPVLYTGLETTRYRFNMGPNFYQTGIPTINPPVITGAFENNRANGPIYPSYVPQVNTDGNDVTGILLPEHLAPLATYAGWNYRANAHDGPDGCESTGSYIPFAATTPSANDPRPSVSQRFPTYGAYLNAVVASVDRLVWNRFALCGVDSQAMLANKLTTAYASSIAAGAPSNQQPAIVPANADWTYVTGQNPSTPVPPAIIPACNAALTHNYNGATGQLQTGAAIQVPLIAGFDGNSDILWRDTSGNVALWLMNGTTIQQSSVLANIANTWSIVGQRDFNADGNTDILWRDTQGNVAMMLMNGSNIQSTTVLGNVPTSWSVVGTIGFNTGGYNNILWRNSNGDIGVWFMNGTTVVSSAIIGNLPTNFVIAGSDSRGNVFWRNTATGDVMMTTLNGTQVGNVVDLGVVLPTWSIAGVGDFDGNGSTDLLWKDNSGNFAISLLTGSSITSTVVVGNLPTNWSLAATGDYNGDGKSDLLWKDSSGDVGVMFMNGTTISSQFIYGNVGPTWSVQAMNSD